MALLSLSARLLEPAAVGRHRAGSVTAACSLPAVRAAGGGAPSPPPPPRHQAAAKGLPKTPRTRQPASSQQQQQQEERQQLQARQLHGSPLPPAAAAQMQQQHERMAGGWLVPRTRLSQFPEETQARIVAGGARGGQPRRAASAPAAAAAAGAAPEGRGALAELAADLQKLCAVLEYERQAGHVNVVGSVERVPAGEWATRQLLSAAGRLATAGCGDAVHACVAAAGGMSRYAQLGAAQRAAAVDAAEGAARDAQLALRAGGRQERHAAPQAQPQPQPLPVAPAAPTPAGGHGERRPAATAQPPPPGLVAAGAAPAVPDRELDAAAAEAHAEESGEQPHTPEGEAYVMSGGRRIKAATAAFRRSFAEAAAAAAGAPPGGVEEAAAAGAQRSAAWHRLRERRLTASAFSKAIGLFEGDRQQLWGEKVGLVQPFAGNAATRWGTAAEPRAHDAYQAATGQRITSCSFKVKRDDLAHGWLGASPDGIIESLALEPPGGGGGGGARAPPAAWAAAAAAGAPLEGPGRGILEIKCPFNRGQPEQAAPPPHATWYYMPQVQGLMYIFDAEWCNLYIWTPARGSAVYHVRRDREYWAALWRVLADFWWQHVVPARQEFAAGRWEEVEAYRPSAAVSETEELRQWSKRMALAAPATFLPPQPEPPAPQ